MSANIASLTIVLKKGVTTQGAQALADAISLFDEVVAVKIGEPEDIDLHIAEQRIRHDLTEKLWNALYSEEKVTA